MSFAETAKKQHSKSLQLSNSETIEKHNQTFGTPVPHFISFKWFTFRLYLQFPLLVSIQCLIFVVFLTFDKKNFANLKFQNLNNFASAFMLIESFNLKIISFYINLHNFTNYFLFLYRPYFSFNFFLITSSFSPT